MTCGRPLGRLLAGHPRSFVCLLALATAIPAAASDALELPSRVAYRVVNDATVRFDRARHGMNKFDVYVALGAPSSRLSADVWVYTDCRLVDDPERRSPYDTMVFEFAQDRLVRMKMVEGKILRAAVAKMTKAPPGAPVAAAPK